MTAIHSQIKIMHVISRMNVGGPAVMISESIRMLDSNRFEQKLYTGDCEPWEADYLGTHAQDINSIRVRGLGRKVNFAGDMTALIILYRAIKEYQPDIVHTHASKAGVLGRLAAILSRQNCKLVHTFHGHILFGYFGKSKTKIFATIEKVLAKKTDVLVAVGMKVRDDLLKAKIGVLKQYLVIYPGVKKPQSYNKELARQLLGIEVPDRNLVCAYFGRLTQIKRPDRFLSVAKECQELSLPISFFMAGDGDETGNTRKAIEKYGLNVTLLGWQEDVGLVLSAADILLITSDNEGLPLSAIEAGMVSLPVISTDVGSIREIVVDGETGFIAERNYLDIVSKMLILIENFSLTSTLGESAHTRTQSMFSSEQYIRSLEKLYQSM